MVVMIAAVGVVAWFAVRHFGVGVGMFGDAVSTAVQPESVGLIDARPVPERRTVTPEPAGAAATLCAAWECDCQALSNLYLIAHSRKDFGRAADKSLVTRWWLDQRCRTDPTEAAPPASVANALDALVRWVAAKVRRGSEVAPMPTVLPSPESAAREWTAPAWIKKRMFSAAAAPLWSATVATHVMVVAGDFCVSPQHCEATTGATAEHLHMELTQGRLRVWVALTAMLRSLLAGAATRPTVVHVVVTLDAHAEELLQWWRSAVGASPVVAPRATLVAHIMDAMQFEKEARHADFPFITVNPAGIFQFVKLYAAAILAPRPGPGLGIDAVDLAAKLPRVGKEWERALLAPRNLIVLDCDNIVLVDIDELWALRARFEEEANKNAVVAIAADFQLATEASAKESFEIYEVQPIESDKHRFFLREGRRIYGNSGVLLYDLTRARAAHFVQKAIPDSARLFAKRHRGFANSFWPPEQDALNAHFAMQPTSFFQLPTAFNANCASGTGASITFPIVSQRAFNRSTWIAEAYPGGSVPTGKSQRHWQSWDGQSDGAVNAPLPDGTTVIPVVAHKRPFPTPAAILHYCGSFHPAQLMHWYERALEGATHSSGNLPRHSPPALQGGRPLRTEVSLAASVAAAQLPRIEWREAAFFRFIQLKQAREVVRSKDFARLGELGQWWGTRSP